MNTLSYKTVSVSKEQANKEWVLVDAENQVVGRLASRVAMILRGKHKPSYTPHSDCGDHVIIINAAKAVFTGDKDLSKEYIRHSGYPGGQRRFSPSQMKSRKPEFVLEAAVKGMLPKNRLGRAIMGNLYVYEGGEHPHQAQQPKSIDLNTIR